MTYVLGDRARHRTVNGDFLLRQAAFEIVRPINRQIECWQSRAAFLATATARDRVRGEHKSALIEEAAELVRRIERTKVELSERAVGAPADVRTHTKVLDTLRALDHLSATLQTALR